MTLALAFVGIIIAALGIHRALTKRPVDTDWYQLRPSGSPPDLEHVVQHAVSAVGQLGGNVTAVMTRRPEGVINAIGVPAGTSRAGVNSIARAVNAVIEPTEPPPLSAGVAVIGQVSHKFSWAGATSNQGDTAHAAKAIGDALTGYGDWVAVVARPQTSRESNAIRKWYAHIEDGPAIQTHPCCAKGAMTAELWSGAVNREVAASHLSTLVQSLAGFDVTTKAGRVSIINLRLIVAGITFLAAMVAAWWGYFTPATLTASAAIIAIPQFVMWRHRDWYGMRRRLAALRNGSPRRVPRLGLIHQGYKNEARNEDGSIKRFESNNYPLGDHRFPFGAQHFAFMAAPHSGAASGSVSVRQKEAAAELSKPGGVLIGTVGDGEYQRNILLPNSTPRTIMAVGVPGAGKSQTLRSVFASDCLARVKGEQRAMIVLESQGGKQVGRWTNIAARIGVPDDDVVVIDINDPATPAINMFAGDGTPHMLAGRFLDLFFESDESGNDGGVALTPSLQALLAVAMEIPAGVAQSAAVRVGSPIWYASVLSGSQAGGDGTAQTLWKSFVEYAKAREVAAAAKDGIELDSDVALSAAVLQRTGTGDAAIRLEPYMQMKEQERRREFQPAQRRLAALMSIDSWFSPDRKRYDWSELIADGKVVVLNHGDPAAADVNPLEPQWADRLSRMLLAGVQTGIRTACQGWEDEGRRLTVNADELSIVAGAAPDTPEWLRQQARKYGVDLCFATQAAHQLDDKLLKTVLGFGTVIWLQLGNEPTLLELARNFLSVEAGVWDGIVESIPQYHGIVLTSVDGQRVPGALVKMEQVGDMPLDELRRRTYGK